MYAWTPALRHSGGLTDWVAPPSLLVSTRLAVADWREGDGAAFGTLAKQHRCRTSALATGPLLRFSAKPRSVSVPLTSKCRSRRPLLLGNEGIIGGKAEPAFSLHASRFRPTYGGDEGSEGYPSEEGRVGWIDPLKAWSGLGRSGRLVSETVEEPLQCWRVPRSRHEHVNRLADPPTLIEVLELDRLSRLLDEEELDLVGGGPRALPDRPRAEVVCEKYGRRFGEVMEYRTGLEQDVHDHSMTEEKGRVASRTLPAMRRLLTTRGRARTVERMSDRD